MSKIKVSSLRGPSSVSQDSAKERLVSVDGLRWAISANRKRALPNHRFDIVKVWTLKERVKGKVVTVDINRGEDEARAWVFRGTEEERGHPCSGGMVWGIRKGAYP